MDPIGLIIGIDRALFDAVTGLRTGPVTPVMRLASDWWVKSLAIPAIGVAAEVARRPRSLPPTIPLAAVALALASLSSSTLKDLVDRARPTLADPSLTALIGLPGDSSFPSGHATSAFAAAGIVAALHPSLRAPAFALASVVAVSRVYLGVHHPVDITVGALLGLLIAVVVVVTSQRAVPAGRWRTTLSTPALTARMRRWPRPLTA